MCVPVFACSHWQSIADDALFLGEPLRVKHAGTLYLGTFQIYDV